jgi:cation-transporting ATPase E
VTTAGFGTAVYAYRYEHVVQFLGSARTPAEVISDFESYAGLTATDADFTTAAATIGAQTGLSTFVSLASFLLILFLAPPTPDLRRLEATGRRLPSSAAGCGCSSRSPQSCSCPRCRATSG